MAITCNSDQSMPRTGECGIGFSELKTIIGIIALNQGTELSTTTSATVNDMIGAGTITPVYGAGIMTEYEPEDDPFEDLSAGNRASIRKGKQRFKLTAKRNLNVMQELEKLDGKNFDVIFVMANEQLLGRSYDATANTIKGFSTSMLSTGNISAASDEGASGKAFYIDLLSNKEFNEESKTIETTYSILDIKGVLNTVLTLVGSDVRVSYVSSQIDESFPKGITISGLDDEFILTDDTPITGITESTTDPGLYTGFVAATAVTLTAPANQTFATIGQFVYATNSVTIPT